MKRWLLQMSGHRLVEYSWAGSVLSRKGQLGGLF